MSKKQTKKKTKQNEQPLVDEANTEEVSENLETSELEETIEDDIIDVSPTSSLVEKQEELELVDIKQAEYAKIIRENLSYCANEIKEVDATMKEISSQKGGESFFKKGENIKIISEHVSRVSNVQQKTLDLLVLLIGASGKMAQDYDVIMETIDELSELNGEEAAVLNYLIKVKNMIREIKSNDDHLNTIKEDIAKMGDRFSDYDEKISINNKGLLVEIKELRLEINKHRSSYKRLERKINRNTLYILGITVVFLVLFAVIYLKVF